MGKRGFSPMLGQPNPSIKPPEWKKLKLTCRVSRHPGPLGPLSRLEPTREEAAALACVPQCWVPAEAGRAQVSIGGVWRL